MQQDRLQETQLLERNWLSGKTFEVKLSRPESFTFVPGQRIRFFYEDLERDYSMVSVAEEPNLALCIRQVEGGAFSSIIGSASLGTRFQFTGPHGYFVFRPSRRPAVFVATGTGIAPFCSMVRSGTTGFTLLHGVRTAEELYYAELFSAAARHYVPCLSGVSKAPRGAFKGLVTGYLQKKLRADRYDFYLCGREDMIRDAIWLIDERFPGSFVYTEIFY